MEVRGVLVGVALCLLGFALFVYGISNMTSANTVSNSFLVVISIFLGVAGLLVLITNAFSSGSLFA